MTGKVITQLRFAHISDVHLPTPLPIPIRRLLNKRALSLLSWQLSRRRHHLATCTDRIIEDIRAAALDMILNTGDITNLGDPSEFQAAEAWMRSLPAPARFVPGNHDLLIKESQNDLTRLAPWMEGQSTTFPYVTKFGYVSIIGVNSARPTPPFMAWGRVEDAQCARLRDALIDTRGTFRVVMIHHPPRFNHVIPRKALKNIGTVADILRNNGAELVLHGHAHNETLHCVEGSAIPLLGVSSMSMHAHKPWRSASWNQISIDRTPQGWTLRIAQRLHSTTGQIVDGLRYQQQVVAPAS